VPEAHKHCHHCGEAYILLHTRTKTWPRTCGVCGETVWRNPIPVVVSIVRVGTGLLTVRRDIEPERGKLAFPGGYIDYGETWQQAASRELFEETSEMILLNPENFSLLGIENASNGNILIFCACRDVILSLDVDEFEPNPEVTELEVIQSPTALAWATHTKFAKRYFEGGKAWPGSIS
jgi:8-oxo-dGTP pyrophosphatase MutT (NUDIX family)